MEASVQFLYHDLQGSQMQRSRPPIIVGRLTDQVEIVQPPSGLSVLLLHPVCVGPLLFTKEKHRRVPSPNAELTEFSFVCHVLFLKRFACSIDCPILLHDIAFVVVVVLVELVGTPPPPELVVSCVGRKSWLDCLGPDNLCVYLTDLGGG